MKLLIHVHVFHKELWDALVPSIRNLCNYDHELYFTTPHEDVELKQTIINAFPEGHYLTLPNDGYDITPFLTILKRVNLDDFDYIAKLHTKRDVSRWVNAIPFYKSWWRNYLLAPFKGRNLTKTLSTFQHHPSIGMIAHDALIMSHDTLDDVATAKNRLTQYNLTPPQNCHYVPGTMFIARAKLFKPFQDTELTNGLSPFALERAFGYIVEAQNFKIHALHHDLWFYESTYPIRLALLLTMRTIYRIFFKWLISR